MSNHPAFDIVTSLDAELLQLERSRLTLPARVALGENRAAAATYEAAAAGVSADLAPLAEKIRALEVDVASLAERRATVEARLASSTGASRDLVAMDAERQHLAERQSKFEDVELTLMEQTDPLEAKLVEIAALLAPLEEEARTIESTLAEEEAELDSVIAARREERAAAATGVDASLLARYDKIGSKLGGVGAARLVDGRCGGCHLALAAAELDDLRRLAPDEVGTCDQCGRILLRPGQFAE